MKKLPDNKKTIDNYIISKEKLNKIGKLAKHKVWVIIQRFLQIFRKDLNKTFISISYFMTLLIIFTITVFCDFEVHDVTRSWKNPLQVQVTTEILEKEAR